MEKDNRSTPLRRLFLCDRERSGNTHLHSTGVADLYDLFRQEPSFMKGACIADKVIGKAAAGLMVLGGIRRVYADVISQPALTLLHDANVEVTYIRLVPFIENRDKSGGVRWKQLARNQFFRRNIPDH